MKQTIKILVCGDVQGVFFRSFAKKQANRFNIKGFTRNINNGEVEIIAQGKEKDLKKFTEQIKIGPKFAKIEKIDVSRETLNETIKNFEIKY